MVVETPIREFESVQSAPDQTATRGSGDAAHHASASAGSAFDESASRKPVEVLIEEARRRARRRRTVIGAVAAATVAIAAIAGTASLDGGPPQSREAAIVAPVEAASFGVFEPVRGRIAYVVERELQAVDPADPSSVQALALPDEIVGQNMMAAGWSADGTRLALTSEHSGTAYVMDADGAVTPVPSGGGCCWFVADPWLSPDGTTAMRLNGGDRLRLLDLAGVAAPRDIELSPPVGDLGTGAVPVMAWSPDGDRIAYLAYEQVRDALLPTVHVVDLGTGDARQLVGPGFGHIRQMAWSPDGSRLLVIAGPWSQSTIVTSLNPAVWPQETGLYLVAADRSASAAPAATLQPIASGHYLAATWSPDGAQIAAVDFASGRRIVVMGADGSEWRVLADLSPGQLFTGLAWHPGSTG